MMASKAIGNGVRYVTKRGYAAQANPAPARPAQLSNKTLANKVIATAYDSGAPIHRVTVAFNMVVLGSMLSSMTIISAISRAGARYEPPNETGASHLLRAAAGLTTSQMNTFLIHRKLAQVGATFAASCDREFIYYTIEATSNYVDEASEILSRIVSCQEFRPWELSDISKRLAYDTVILSPQARAMDLVHKAAYRRGLGNSLYISPKRIGKISSESLRHFAQGSLKLERAAVAVVGCGLDRACSVANQLRVLENIVKPHEEPTKYYGGEQRKEMGGELAHIVIALPGAKFGTPEASALAIAAKALGNGPMTKWGNDTSCLGQILGSVTPAAAAGFSVNYSDSGLFGVVISVSAEAACVATSIAKMLKTLALSPDRIKAAKNQLKVALLSEAEGGAMLSETLAAAALYGPVKTPSAIATEIDNISDEAVNHAVRASATFKFSMAAVGNLTCTPFVDDLLS